MKNIIAMLLGALGISGIAYSSYMTGKRDAAKEVELMIDSLSKGMDIGRKSDKNEESE